LLVVGLLVALTAAARAQPEVAARAAAEGRAAFAAGDYARAIARFEEARAGDDDPAHVFKIAQAYRQLGDCGEAGAYFQAYVRATTPGALNRDRAVALADDMARCAERAARPRRERGRSWRRRIGLAIGGSGAAALAAAALFAWQSRDASLEVTGAIADGRAATWTAALDDLEERGQRAERLALGLVIGGAAALVSGGTLLVGPGGPGLGWRF
jgi:tetratricopeptide (TPR) repeat protein